MKIMDIALKDMLRSLRNIFLIGMVVAAPLLIVGLIYFAFGGMSNERAAMPVMQVGVVNHDQLPEAARSRPRWARASGACSSMRACSHGSRQRLPG